jgi:tetratricopeptide (TPR) repeat protein
MGIHFDRGQALFALQRYQEAVVEYQQELAEQPGCVFSKANIASSLINLGKLSDARVAVQETLAQAPEYGFAYYLLSFVEPKSGGESPALRAINEAVRLEPTVVRNVTRLGWLLREQGRHAECLETTTRALQLDPRSVDTLVLRANALEALGQPDDAAATLRAALAINPENPDAHLALGNVALACGDPGEALEALREARRISPVKHHQREKILDAYARRIWPFRQIDAQVKWYWRQSQFTRWGIRAVACTALLAVHAVVKPTDLHPSPPLTVFYFLIVNGLLFISRASQYSQLLVRIIKRRELDMRLTAVLAENAKMLLWLAFSHWVASIFAIILSFSPVASFLTFAAAMMGPLVLGVHRALTGARFLENGCLPMIGLLVIFTPPAILGGIAFGDYDWAIAWGVWAAMLAITGLTAAFQQRLARRRRG